MSGLSSPGSRFFETVGSRSFSTEIKNLSMLTSVLKRFTICGTKSRLHSGKLSVQFVNILTSYSWSCKSEGI